MGPTRYLTRGSLTNTSAALQLKHLVSSAHKVFKHWVVQNPLIGQWRKHRNGLVSNVSASVLGGSQQSQGFRFSSSLGALILDILLENMADPKAAYHLNGLLPLRSTSERQEVSGQRGTSHFGSIVLERFRSHLYLRVLKFDHRFGDSLVSPSRNGSSRHVLDHDAIHILVWAALAFRCCFGEAPWSLWRCTSVLGFPPRLHNSPGFGFVRVVQNVGCFELLHKSEPGECPYLHKSLLLCSATTWSLVRPGAQASH